MLNVQEKLENFYNTEINNYNDRWGEKACDLIADIYALGLNEKWCVARLENCDSIAIHKAIINRCRDMQDFWAISDSDKKVVKRLLEEHKKELFGLLNADIYNYCVR